MEIKKKEHKQRLKIINNRIKDYLCLKLNIVLTTELFLYNDLIYIMYCWMYIQMYTQFVYLSIQTMQKFECVFCLVRTKQCHVNVVNEADDSAHISDCIKSENTLIIITIMNPFV
jgi:hypothetical protein